VKRLLLLLVCCVALFSPGRALAHDLAIDTLTLWPEPARGELRGQLLFDPLLTRARGTPADEAARRRVVAFLTAELRIEVDGKNAPLTFRVRELWTGDGAIQGDSVMLTTPLPDGARELRVFVPTAFRALALSVETPDATGTLVARSTLVLGGQSSPPYRLAAEQGETWRPGGPAELPLGALRHAADAGGTASTPADVGFAEESKVEVALRYVVLGVQHILPHGWDHVLFVAGLVLGARGRLRALLLQLTGFTLAHTLTLALGVLGWLVVPARIVEPLIALSIAYVGFENLRRADAPRPRLPWVLAFGLLHGQGFAGALLETGISEGAFAVALVSFNVGVELGQLVVVGLLLGAISRIRDEAQFHRYVLRPGSLLIVAMGLFWTIERLFWNG
jgi:hypothetical protein